jgi:hypothetical protein
MCTFFSKLTGLEKQKIVWKAGEHYEVIYMVERNQSS